MGYSDGRLTAPRLDFEVGGKGVTFQDVNNKEFRQLELSRYFDPMAPPTLQPCCSCSVNATAASLGKVAAYLSMGGTLDGDKLLSASAWQVQLLTETEL